MKYELLNNTKVKPLIKPNTTGVAAGTITTAYIDRYNFMTGIFGVALGDATGVPTSYTVVAKVITADDNIGTNKTDVTDMDGNIITLTLDADGAYGQLDVDLLPAKQYVALEIVTTFTGGTTPAVPINAYVALGDIVDTRN